ncbi:MAG: DUF1425 domain-containing protein [Planctomycetota bacterium]
MNHQQVVRPIVAAVLLALAVSIGGCSSSVNTIENRDKRAAVTPVADERVITDAYFDRRVVVTSLIEDTGPDGNRIAEAEAMNTSNAYQRFRYQYTWFNEAGRAITSLSSTWVDESIAPGAMKRLTSVAPNASAQDFRLEILRYNP